MSPISNKKRNTLRAIVLAAGIATALAALTGCSPAAPVAPKPVQTADATHTVKENGNGRIDSGESLTVPNTKADLIKTACTISKSGKLTAVEAQALNGYGQYMNYFAIQPNVTLNPATGAATVADATKLAAIYIPLGQHAYELTLKANIDLPSDVKSQLDKVCAGDIFAGK
jgi:hypothetical protein